MADFYFKTNKFQSLLLQIPKSLRVPVTIFLLFITCAAWFMTLYKPLQCSYHAALAHYATLNSFQSIQTKIDKKTAKIKKQAAQKEVLINGLKLESSQQEIINNTIANLFSCAHDAHITVIRHVPNKIEDHQLSLNSHFCDELHGSFEDIIVFLRLLTEKKVALQPLSIKIAQQNQDDLSLVLDYSINVIKDFNENI